MLKSGIISTVVISSHAYNQQKPDLIIMGITSQFTSSLTLGELLIIDFLGAGLIKPSVIKPDQLLLSYSSINQTSYQFIPEVFLY